MYVVVINIFIKSSYSSQDFEQFESWMLDNVI